MLTKFIIYFFLLLILQINNNKIYANIVITADDSIEYINDKNICIAKGNVIITNDKYKIYSSKIIIYLNDDKKKINIIEAIGENTKIILLKNNKNIVLKANTKAVYNVTNNILNAFNDVVIEYNDNIIRSNSIKMSFDKNNNDKLICSDIELIDKVNVVYYNKNKIIKIESDYAKYVLSKDLIDFIGNVKITNGSNIAICDKSIINIKNNNFILNNVKDKSKYNNKQVKLFIFKK